MSAYGIFTCEWCCQGVHDQDAASHRCDPEMLKMRISCLTQRDTPVTDKMIRAASESCARDDEGEFPPLCDLIGYSGENKTRTVVRAALLAAMEAKS